MRGEAKRPLLSNSQNKNFAIGFSYEPVVAWTRRNASELSKNGDLSLSGQVLTDATNMQKTKLNVFITAPSGSDVSHLKNILTQRGLSVLSFDDEIVSGDRWLHTLSNLIRKADIVFAVLGEGSSENVMFELGFAASLNKKLVIIGHSRTPMTLSDFPHLTVDLSDRRALEFQVEALLKNLDQIETTLFYDDIKPSNRLPRSRESKVLNRNAATYSLAQERLLQILEASPEIDSVVVEPISNQSAGFRPDLAFRFSAEPNFFPGPIAVELKVSESGQIRKEWIELIADYASKLHYGVGLLVVDSPRANDLRAIGASPLVLTVGLQEFEQLLQTQKTAMEFRRARNKFIHSTNDHA